MKYRDISSERTEQSRRAFLTSATLAGAGMMAAPLLLTSRKSVAADAPGVLGVGKHRYEWEGDWAKLPKSKSFGYTQGVSEDSQGRIYIFNNSTDAVAVFDPDGAFMTSWGAEYESGAHGIQLSVEGGQEFFYLSLTNQHRIVKTTLDGEVVWEKGYPAESGVYFNPEGYSPTNIAMAPNGDFYVCDGYGSNYVHHYNKDAEYVRTWGGTGSEIGQFKQPHGIWVDTRDGDPKVLIADRGNMRIVYYTLDGEYVSKVDYALSTPCHFHQRGDFLLMPELWGKISILNMENDIYARLGQYRGAPKLPNYPNIAHELRLPGKFSSPHQAIWDSQGNIFCVEWINDGRVTKLRHVD